MTSFVLQTSECPFTCPCAFAVCWMPGHTGWAERSARPHPTPDWPHISPQQLEDHQATYGRCQPPATGRDSGQEKQRGQTRWNQLIHSFIIIRQGPAEPAEGREEVTSRTLNLSMATEASDRDLTENGVTFREKVIALNTVTTVKACRHRRQQHELMVQQVNTGNANNANSMERNTSQLANIKGTSSKKHHVYCFLCGTWAAVRLYPSNKWVENVSTLAMTTTMGATPTVKLWK